MSTQLQNIDPYPQLFDLVHQKDWTTLLIRHGEAHFHLRVYDEHGELKAGVRSPLMAPFCFKDLAEKALRDLRAQGLAPL